MKKFFASAAFGLATLYSASYETPARLSAQAVNMRRVIASSSSRLRAGLHPCRPAVAIHDSKRLAAVTFTRVVPITGMSRLVDLPVPRIPNGH